MRISSILFMALVALPAAAGAQETKAGEKRVTLVGCVVAGTHPGTFIMTHVNELPGNADPVAVGTSGHMPDVFYRLADAKGLKAHVGHRVAVTGNVEMDDVDHADIKMKVDKNHPRDTTIEVETEGGQVKAKVNTPATITGAKAEIKQDEVAVRKLTVKSIKMLSNSCS